jgi:hypothetical protein
MSKDGPRVNQLLRVVDMVGNLRVGELVHVTEVRNHGEHVRVSRLNGERATNNSGANSFNYKSRFEVV